MIKCLLCVPVIKIFMVEVNLYNIYLETKAEIEIGPVFFLLILIKDVIIFS